MPDLVASQGHTERSGGSVSEPTPPGAPATREHRWRLAAVLLVALGVGWLLLGLSVFPAGEGWGYDYRAYLDASVRLAETGSLYQAETLDGPFRPGPFGLYLYAPPLGIAISPLTDLPLEVGTTAWFALHVAALALACALMPVRLPIRLAAFGIGALSYAVTRDLVLGNVSVLLLLPTVVAWRWLDRPMGSAALALAIAVRPTLGIFLAWQLLRRAWRAFVWTVGVGVGLVLLTLPVVGPDGYREYLSVLTNMSDVTGVERNIDLGSTVFGLSGDASLAGAALLVGYGVALLGMLLALRRDPEVSFMVTLGAATLLSPLLWDHYLAALLLPAAFLAQRGRPWALALPLLSWLPPELMPIVALAGALLPLAARRAGKARPATGFEPVASPAQRQAPAKGGTV